MNTQEIKNLLVLSRKGIGALSDTIPVAEAGAAWAAIASLQTELLASVERDRAAAASTPTP